jgi:large subunit ribosomal protein L4
VIFGARFKGAGMISVPIHNQAGQPTGRTYEFDPAVLVDGVTTREQLNKQLLHDAVVMYEANRRQGTFKSKSRSEIAGSKKKLFKQKGTGRARMGTKRTCIRRGGGHAFAKRPTDFSYSLPRKALQLATRMALLSKFIDGEAVVVDKVSLDRPQTKAVAGMLKSLGLQGQPCLLAIDRHDPTVWLSARNVESLSVSPAADLNAYKLLQRKRLLVTEAALDRLCGKVAAN